MRLIFSLKSVSDLLKIKFETNDRFSSRSSSAHIDVPFFVPNAPLRDSLRAKQLIGGPPMLEFCGDVLDRNLSHFQKSYLKDDLPKKSVLPRLPLPCSGCDLLYLVSHELAAASVF